MMASSFPFGGSAAASGQPPTDIHAMAFTSTASARTLESIATSATFNGALDPTNESVPSASQLEASATAPAAPARRGKSKKGGGKRLTDRERVEILDLLDNNVENLSITEIGRRYGVTRAAIQKLRSKGPEVRARYRYGCVESRDNRKRGDVMCLPFERELYEWVKELKARGVPVPPSLVQEKAKLLVPKYELGNFQASSGWYYNFLRRCRSIEATLERDKASAEAAPEAETVDTAKTEEDPEEDTSLDVDLSPQLHRITGGVQAIVPVYEDQLQQYHQNMAEIAAALLPQQEQSQENTTQETQSKSDRMLMLLEQQNALLERQNSMIEDQAKTIKKMYAAMLTGTAL